MGDNHVAKALSGIYAVLGERESQLWPEEIKTLQAAADILHRLERGMGR